MWGNKKRDERKKKMTEKTETTGIKKRTKNIRSVKRTVSIQRIAAFADKKSLILKGALWLIVGLGLELGASGIMGKADIPPISPAPGAAALAAGLSGNQALFALLGGVIGALIGGFPNAITGLAAMGIVLAARILPDLHNPKVRAAERSLAAAAGVFFSRVAVVTDTAELLTLVVSSIASAVFALCVCLLSDSAVTRGIDIIGEPRDCAAGCVIAALAFLSLGALDTSAVNIGRLFMGLLLLMTAARRGNAWCTAIGVSAALGMCACSANIGAGAAVIAFSAAVSGAFSRFGKLARAAGFLFTASLAMLITGIDEGMWRIFTECAVSAAVFVIVPIEKISVPEDVFSNKTIALMLRERLNFAADAISGIGAGINAAADSLDRRYSAAPDELPEKAADRCCRSCPLSMSCWGKNYELFRAEFARLAGQLRAGVELTEFSMSPECSDICVNKSGVIKAVRSEYSRYLSVMADERRVRELRRIYTDQLAGTRDILRDMANMRADIPDTDRSRAAEKRAEEILAENGMELPQAFVIKDKRGRLRFEAYGATEPRVEPEYLGALLSKSLGRELETPEISGSSGRYRVTAAERNLLSAKLGAFQIPRGSNRVCGDCYEYFTDPMGILYVILSDGMGSGSRARVDSAMACSVLSKLIKSGISLKVALETVNTVLMVKSADESFATLDICRVDLNSGECAVYKAGAATTYIRSKDKLIRAALSSPPAGLGGRLTVPAQKFTVGSGDVILMMTDGIVPDEKWLQRELSRRVEPEDLSERIAKAARSSENARDDDISVIALMVS